MVQQVNERVAYYHAHCPEQVQYTKLFRTLEWNKI